MRAVVSEGPSKPARRSSLRESGGGGGGGGGAGWSMLAWHKSDEQGPRAVRSHYHGKSDAEAAGSVLPAGGRLQGALSWQE